MQNVNTDLSIEDRIEKAFKVSEQFYEHYQKSGKDNTLKNLDNDLAKIVATQEKIIEKLDKQLEGLSEEQKKALEKYFKDNNLISFKNTPEKEEKILEEAVKHSEELGVSKDLIRAYGQKLRVQNRKEFIENSRLQSGGKIEIDKKTNELTGDDKIVFNEIIKETDPIKRSEIFKKGIIYVEGGEKK